MSKFDFSSATGVYTICPTPFDPAGNVDLPSIRSLVRFQLDAGVAGLAILGFMGELHSLDGAERALVTREFIDAAAGAVPVVVGVRALGSAGAVEQAREAQALGATAVFVAPLAGVGEGPQFDFYAAVAKSVSIPVVIHDFPASFATELSPELVARMAREGVCRCIKMEEPPVAQKVTRILELTGGATCIFGGLGGVYFIEELQRGAVGTMTGFSFPEILVEIHRRFASGDHEGAARVFDRYCPLLRYEFQPKIGLAMRKYVYMRRGAIASDTVRAPAKTLDAITARELEAVVKRVGLKLDQRILRAADFGSS